MRSSSLETVENGGAGPSVRGAGEIDPFDLAESGMLIVDSSGYVRRVNPAYCRIVKQPFDEIVGTKFSLYTEPAKRGSKSLSTHVFARNSRAPTLIRKRQILSDGSTVWIDFTIRTITDAKDATTRLFVEARDVTARKSTEDELRRLSAAQHVARLGSFEQDPESDVLEASAELRRLVEIHDDAPMSVSRLMMVVHPDDRERLGNAIRSCFVDHTPVDVVHRLLLCDGAVRWVHALAEWTDATQASRPSVLGTIIDITERELAERAVAAVRGGKS